MDEEERIFVLYEIMEEYYCTMEVAEMILLDEEEGRTAYEDQSIIPGRAGA